ncbi:MAG: hypothetical protein JWL83_3574 [Actinomycetia bacterium]|nr:hypothetical protein [Actinomycetes bacterium]
MAGIAEIWILDAELVAPEVPDLVGYEVSARDGNVGKVEEVVIGDDGREYIVVDTGFWILGKKRMIPAGAIDTIDPKNKRINVRMKKSDIKSAPDYDRATRNDDDVRRSHEDHYKPFSRLRR